MSEFYHSPLPFYLNGSSGTGMSDLDDLLLLTEAHYAAATQRQDVSPGSFSFFVVFYPFVSKWRWIDFLF